MTDEQIKRILWRCIWMSRGEAPVDRDYAYWIPMWSGLMARGVEIGHPNYAEDRVLGWQAGGADVARFGDYAVPPSPYHLVPSYPGDVPIPEPVPNPTPIPMPSVDPRFDRIEAALAEIKGLIISIANRPFIVPDYVGTGKATWLPSLAITLMPTTGSK